jgi:hypothetical protein
LKHYAETPVSNHLSVSWTSSAAAVEFEFCKFGSDKVEYYAIWPVLASADIYVDRSALLLRGSGSDRMMTDASVYKTEQN